MIELEKLNFSYAFGLTTLTIISSVFPGKHLLTFSNEYEELTDIFPKTKHIVSQKLGLAMNVFGHIFSPLKRGDYGKRHHLSWSWWGPKFGFWEVGYWFFGL